MQTLLNQGRNRRESEKSRLGAAQQDFVTGGIIVAAIILFVGTGGRAMSDLAREIAGYGGGSDNLLHTTLILNIALILFAWRRYRDLHAEITERAEAEKRAQMLAATDPLTGFLNRRSITVRGANMINEATRHTKTVAFFMLDLDHFKNVNDVHGHATGDMVLKEAAKRIQAILPTSALISRLGGDEFVCAFKFDPANPDIVNRIAERLVSAMAEPVVSDRLHITISTSIGISRIEAGAETVEALMRRADIAMYDAKKRGRNRFCWFDASMERELRARNNIESGIREGIPLGHFMPFYEQQVELSTGRLKGFEMLARWESPTHGMISPEVFIPIAEECGLITDLSFYLMRRAMEDAKQWDPTLTLSVNVSPTQLKDPWLAQKIVKLLVETGFPAERLEIEITESSLFDNLSLAQSIIGSLKNQGIQIALDDFGTGYSSLAHLRALPFDRIKIDRSFVSSMTNSKDSAAIVAAIARLGESLGMPVTAEGIEDAEIERQLIELGCSKGQGWHFGRPMSSVQTRTLLLNRNLLPGTTADRHAAVPQAEYHEVARHAG